MADLSVTLNIDPEVAIDFVTVGDVDNPADAPDRLDDRLKAIGYVYDIMNVGNDLRTTCFITKTTPFCRRTQWGQQSKLFERRSGVPVGGTISGLIQRTLSRVGPAAAV